MSEKIIIEKLDNIEKILTCQERAKKGILSLTEASKYLDLSASFVYKLTSNNAIPFYKPNGKKIYFRKVDLDEWMLKRRVNTKEKTDKPKL